MSDQKYLYRCEVCGHIIEVVHAGIGQLVCCGQKMTHLEENSVDAAIEKHVPIIFRDDGGITVQIGSIEHPMTEEHYIEWIEIIFDDRIGRQYLRPGDKPVARFNVKSTYVQARAYCNLHGLWKSE